MDDVLICSQCGDPLIKKPFINSRQIFALVTVLAFISPLIIMILVVFYDFTKERVPDKFYSSALLTQIK